MDGLLEDSDYRSGAQALLEKLEDSRASDPTKLRERIREVRGLLNDQAFHQQLNTRRTCPKTERCAAAAGTGEYALRRDELHTDWTGKSVYAWDRLGDYGFPASNLCGVLLRYELLHWSGAEPVF